MIGVAWMTEDRSVHLRLRVDHDDSFGHSLLVFAPGDKEYQSVLDHLGGLKPGDYKSVPAWEDVGN
jgi:hypothetical protein